MALAEQNARKYSQDLGDTEWLGLVQLYALGEGMPGSGEEIFSLMRDSRLGPSDYLDQFFDTGRERQR